MNHQELREAIFSRKPKYSEMFRPLIDRLSVKGDSSKKGDFSTFGPIYQTYMFAYIIGLRLGKKTPFSKDSKKIEFTSIGHFNPTPIRDFIIITLLNRSEEFSSFSWEWLSLENASEDNVDNFVTMLVREMEEYANTGFYYLQEKWDNEKVLFNSPFVFVDILQDLPKRNVAETLED